MQILDHSTACASFHLHELATNWGGFHASTHLKLVTVTAVPLYCIELMRVAAVPLRHLKAATGSMVPLCHLEFSKVSRFHSII